jgi:hypothetical protein
MITFFAQQHDRPYAGFKQSPLGLRNFAELSDRLDIRHHHAERLVALALSFPQPSDRFFIRSIACNMKSSDALDGYDAAVPQCANTFCQSFIAS